jgi:hypothetical protein
MAKVFSAAKEVVDFYADAKLPEGPIGAAIAGKNKGERFGEMRCDIVEDAFFDTGLADEADAALSEVTNAAVEQATGTAARSKSEVMLFDKTGTEPTHGCVARNPGSDDAATDDKDVELGLG